MQEDLSTLVDEYCITKQDLIFSDSGYREEMGWEKIKNWGIIYGQLKQIFEGRI